MRPIDADAMLAELRPITYEMEHSGVTIADMSNIMRNWVERQPTLTPQNEALTIEQLKTMDEEWVMIKAFDREISGTMPAIIKDEFATTLCKLGAKAVVPDLCEVHFPFSEYLKTWIAYRRPPERQEDA